MMIKLKTKKIILGILGGISLLGVAGTITSSVLASHYANQIKSNGSFNPRNNPGVVNDSVWMSQIGAGDNNIYTSGNNLIVEAPSINGKVSPDNLVLANENSDGSVSIISKTTDGDNITFNYLQGENNFYDTNIYYINLNNTTITANTVLLNVSTNHITRKISPIKYKNIFSQGSKTVTFLETSPNSFGEISIDLGTNIKSLSNSGDLDKNIYNFSSILNNNKTKMKSINVKTIDNGNSALDIEFNNQINYSDLIADPNNDLNKGLWIVISSKIDMFNFKHKDNNDQNPDNYYSGIGINIAKPNISQNN